MLSRCGLDAHDADLMLILEMGICCPGMCSRAAGLLAWSGGSCRRARPSQPASCQPTLASFQPPFEVLCSVAEAEESSASRISAVFKTDHMKTEGLILAVPLLSCQEKAVAFSCHHGMIPAVQVSRGFMGFWVLDWHRLGDLSLQVTSTPAHRCCTPSPPRACLWPRWIACSWTRPEPWPAMASQTRSCSELGR